MRKDTPSRTARKVALNIVTLGSRRGMDKVLPAGIVDATGDLLVASGAVGARGVRFSRSRLAVCIYLALDWMMPGQFEAFAHRKAFCERQVRKGIKAGATQVLVLGAGYDTLGWRLAPECPNVKFFEIDHPATARLKARGIGVMGPRENHHLIAEDLGERNLVDVLRTASTWDVSAPSVVVAEGLLMYLPPHAVGVLLEQCAAVSGCGSRMVFTYVGKRGDGRPDAGPWTWLVLRLLTAAGESWLWSMEPDKIEAFLGRHHWRIAPRQSAAPVKHGVEYFGMALKQHAQPDAQPDADDDAG
jgi:methyltransferase (TIGR00027 family)